LRPLDFPASGNSSTASRICGFYGTYGFSILIRIIPSILNARSDWLTSISLPQTLAGVGRRGRAVNLFRNECLRLLKGLVILCSSQ
jgi:hypothetical protein